MSDATTSTIRMNQQDHLLTCSSEHLFARENREFAEPEVTVRLKIAPWNSGAPTIPPHKGTTEQIIALQRGKSTCLRMACRLLPCPCTFAVSKT